MQEIGKFGKKINVIPNNMEKYKSFMQGDNLVFLDNFQFMASSLERLASNIPEDAFNYTSKEFSGKELELVKKKGAYPYDYMDSFQRFEEQKLPNKKDFIAF